MPKKKVLERLATNAGIEHEHASSDPTLHDRSKSTLRTMLKEDDKLELLVRPLMVVSADCGLASAAVNR